MSMALWTHSKSLGLSVASEFVSRHFRETDIPIELLLSRFSTIHASRASQLPSCISFMISILHAERALCINFESHHILFINFSIAFPAVGQRPRRLIPCG